MSFQVYEPRRGGRSGSGKAKKGPAIRISKTTLVLNKWAREAVGSSAVELAYDPDHRMIRVSPGGSLPLKKTKVFAKGFLSRFGITAKGSFPAEVKGGALFAQIP